MTFILTWPIYVWTSTPSHPVSRSKNPISPCRPLISFSSWTYPSSRSCLPSCARHRYGRYCLHTSSNSSIYRFVDSVAGKIHLDWKTAWCVLIKRRESLENLSITTCIWERQTLCYSNQMKCHGDCWTVLNCENERLSCCMGSISQFLSLPYACCQ